MSFAQKYAYDKQSETEDFCSLVDQKCTVTITKIRLIQREYLFFHGISLVLLLLEFVFGLKILFSYPKSLLTAFAFALFVLTLFSYLFLISHWRARRKKNLEGVEKEFAIQVKNKLDPELNSLEYHLLLASASFRLTTQIYHIFTQPLRSIQKGAFDTLYRSLQFALGKEHLFFLQELLMHASIKEHLLLIKKDPSGIEAHTSLANTYIALAKLYKDPCEGDSKQFLFKESFFKNNDVLEKFKRATALAIEELKILDDLAPNDPWVHAQLATCYHHLALSIEEMFEYEHLAVLRPEDPEILFRLGLLYFALGHRAKGLKIYQKLSLLDRKKAESLIEKYDANSSEKSEIL